MDNVSVYESRKNNERLEALERENMRLKQRLEPIESLGIHALIDRIKKLEKQLHKRSWELIPDEAS